MFVGHFSKACLPWPGSVSDELGTACCNSVAARLMTALCATIEICAYYLPPVIWDCQWAHIACLTFCHGLRMVYCQCIAPLMSAFCEECGVMWTLIVSEPRMSGSAQRLHCFWVHHAACPVSAPVCSMSSAPTGQALLQGLGAPCISALCQP